MAADDVEFGHVVDLTLGEVSGTELVAPAAFGATTLTVDYAGDFEDAGEVTLKGQVFAYTGIVYGDAETDPDVITLAAPLPISAATDDKVIRMAGGQQVTEWTLHVSLGDGHPVDIPIPFEQRAMWSRMDVSTPVPVLVSADLERLVEVPGRIPVLDQTYINTCFNLLYQASDVSWPDSGTYATMTDWSGVSQQGIDFNASTGKLTMTEAGVYLFTVSVAWGGSSVGRRYVRLVLSDPGGTQPVRTIPGAPPDALFFTQQIVWVGHLVAGAQMYVEAHQTSGAALAIQGDSLGTLTGFQVVRLQA